MTACSCRPCGIRCMHGVALRRALATRVLAQTTGAPNLFQAGAIAWQDQWCAVRLLSTLDILRASWLAGFGTLPCGQVAEASSGRNPRPLLMWSGHVRVRPGVYSTSGRLLRRERTAAPRLPTRRREVALRVCRWPIPPYGPCVLGCLVLGILLVPSAGAVIGGQQAPVGAWPFAAALIDASTSDTLAGEICGAVVVAPREVLTAAHCVTVDGSAQAAQARARRRRRPAAAEGRVGGARARGRRSHPPRFQPRHPRQRPRAARARAPGRGQRATRRRLRRHHREHGTGARLGLDDGGSSRRISGRAAADRHRRRARRRLRRRLRRGLRRRDDAVRGRAPGRPGHVPGRFRRPAGRRRAGRRRRDRVHELRRHVRPARSTGRLRARHGRRRLARGGRERRAPSARRRCRSAGRARAASGRSRSPPRARAR